MSFGPREHAYGERVHLHGDAWSLASLARVSSPEISQTELYGVVRSLYAGLLARVMAQESPTIETEVSTRMAAVHGEKGAWQGTVVDPGQNVVIVDIVRGGMVPCLLYTSPSPRD